MCVCLKSLKNLYSLDAGDCGHRTQRKKKKKKKKKRAFGFMLTAEELNRCSFGRPNRIPIVIDDDVRPLVYICGFLLINRLSGGGLARMA